MQRPLRSSPDFSRPHVGQFGDSRRVGFSLLELVVVIVIILILLAISIPFVRDLRSITRRSNCTENLTRLAVALQAYSSDFGHLPSGTASYNANFELFQYTGLSEPSQNDSRSNGSASNGSDVNNSNETRSDTDAVGDEAFASRLDAEIVRSLPKGYHHNWIAAILPYLDRRGMYEAIDFDFGVYSRANRLVREADIAVLRCPSAEETQLPNTTSYVGIHDSRSVPIGTNNNGLLMLNRWVVPEKVPDGMSHTLLLGEKISPPELDLGWISGTRSSLRNTGTPINAFVPMEEYRDPLFVGSLASNHAGGATVALGDTSVRFLSQTIDPDVLQKLASGF